MAGERQAFPAPHRGRPCRGGRDHRRGRRMSWSEARNLLCLRLDSVGDVLMTTPAVRACRESFGGRITLLTSSAGAAAAKYVPEIDEVIEFAAPWMKVPAPGSTEWMLAELKARAFDAAVIFTVYSQ